LKAELTKFSGEVPEHPDLTALFTLILNADPVFTATGMHEGNPYVIVTAIDDAQFTFTKTGDGYLLTRGK
jgi:hypothetical protein